MKNCVEGFPECARIVGWDGSCSGGARDSMLPGHSQVNYSANQGQEKIEKHYVTVPLAVAFN